MSVHKSAFWGPFFAMVAFSLLVLFIKGCNDAAVANAEWEAQVRSDSIRNAYYAERQAYDDSIKVIGDSIRRAEFVKDSTSNARRRAAATRRANLEKCNFLAWSDTANFGNEGAAYRECVRRYGN